MFEDDRAAAVVSIFVENDRISPRDVNGTDAIVPEIIGVDGRPFAGNGKGSAAIAVMFKYRNGGGGEITTIAATARATNMRSWRALVMRATMMSNGDEPDGRNTIVPVVILTAGPLAPYDQVLAAKTAVFEQVGFVATGDDDGINGVVPVIVGIIDGPVGVDVQSFSLEIGAMVGYSRWAVVGGGDKRREQ